MVKRLHQRGQNQNFFYQILSKDYVTGVKTLRNQTYAYQELNLFRHDLVEIREKQIQLFTFLHSGFLSDGCGQDAVI